jgi:hypothetical protein
MQIGNDQLSGVELSEIPGLFEPLSLEWPQLASRFELPCRLLTMRSSIRAPMGRGN